MNYFNNIASFGDLKKQYRRLAVENHPDKGGSTGVMQQINLEFEKLYKIWEHRQPTEDHRTGYENDYKGATAREYTDHVYHEYKWCGKNYKGQGKDEITKIIRTWLKEAYPDYRFSVTQKGYKSINIFLLEADFPAFKDGINKVIKSINQYWIDDDDEITDRMKEVAKNIKSFALSYNIDDTDSQQDYFFTNFYLDIHIGSSIHPYKIIIPRSRRTKGEMPPAFSYPEGKANKAIRQALNGACFHLREVSKIKRNILCTKNIWEDGSIHFYGLSYSSSKVAQKRIDKLSKAGILSRTTGWNGGYIEFLGYTEETQDALRQEWDDYITAYNKWKANH